MRWMGKIPISGAEAYAKNLTMRFGRCPVRAVFADALEVLKRRSHVFGWASLPFPCVGGNHG